jgi:hypothetical protein
MNFQFKKATKERSKLRLAIFGPSGSGKTFTSLRLAKGLGGKVAVIDTERGSASKYSDRFVFDVLDLEDCRVEVYVQAINAAQKAGYDVLIIDSLTHGWFELLDEVDRIAKARYSGNTFAAWSEGTPKQRAMVDALLDFDGHIIATMRSKTEWVIEKDDRGRNRPVRVGTAPRQGKGIEYEFDMLVNITVDHVATVEKDRTGKFQDRIIEKPGEDLGQALADWLQEGKEPEPEPEDAGAPPVEFETQPPGSNFQSQELAIKWGLEQGVFNHANHARNAYEKLKAEHSPQSATEMRDLWVNDVANRLVDLDAVSVENAEEVEYE